MFKRVIIVDDFLWYSCYVEFHIFRIWESVVEVKNIYISAKTHFASVVNTTLLNKHFAVVMVAVGVVSVPE